MAQSPSGGAVRALQLELKNILAEPVEGFNVRLQNEDNIFEWEVAIFGPPGTLYEGGYFKVTIYIAFLILTDVTINFGDFLFKNVIIFLC